ncbi:putative transmembrane protein [Gregarina niphandrodes]|uniref:Transmembrane protein n=1 Tax=Gregarina niphandrodes TaxID=110365 RepID=A0A023B3T3_GRENI|nr:putative transmembrane protein [Gregarina niphandrodes]EZG55953.1 putative transmembrane protein [Gregarina niphandrodes]|eukprot:XP_011131396.1 putative transmembrane protein [Gregarina niphandrodes]
MRSSTILLVLASVVMGETAVGSVATAVVVDCSEFQSKLSAAESKIGVQASELKTAAASLEARAQLVSELEAARTKLQTERASLEQSRASVVAEVGALKTERDGWLSAKSALETRLEKETSALKARLDSEVSALKGQVEAAKKTEAETRALYDGAKKELVSLQSRTSQLGQLETNLSELESSLKTCEQDAKKRQDALTREQANERAENQKKHTALTRQLTSTSEKLARLESRIFSEDHLAVLLKNTRRVALAFANNVRANVNRVFDADVVEILRLHSAILTEKARPHARQAVTIYRTRVVEPFVRPYILEPYAMQYRDKTHALVNEYREKAYTLLDNRMNRMLDSLSKSDPEIRQLFPETFFGRLLAFTYIFAVFYAALSVFSYLTGLIWIAIKKMVSVFFVGKTTTKTTTKKTTSAPNPTTKQPVIGNQATGNKNIRFRK